MGADSKIEWTDHTFNPWRGCTKVSAGCANCYAETASKRFPKVRGIWGPDGTRVVAAESTWATPKKWNRLAEVHGRARVFCASLADWAEKWTGVLRGSGGGYLHHAEAWNKRGRGYLEVSDIAVGHSCVTLDDVRDRLFKLIDTTPALDWLMLTKRPENIGEFWYPIYSVENGIERFDHTEFMRPNVWLGTSIENQATADERIPQLLRWTYCAPVRFLSIEPLLGPVNLGDCLGEMRMERCSGCQRISEEEADCPGHEVGGIDWVIVGGESGPDSRPCDLAWIRSIRDQCKAAGVPCFIKQLGRCPQQEARHRPYCGATITGPDYLKFADPKGGDWDEWPDDLRVRQFPKPGAVNV